MEDLGVTNPEAFAGRRVLVTGHTGFKGSWLSIWLQMLGAEVAGFALDPPAGPSMFNATRAGANTLDHRGDIRDAEAIRTVVAKFNPEIVFHLAAQAIVKDGYRDPLETYGTNVMGTATLLNACRHAPGIRAIVVVSSDKCYENRNWPWGYRENDRLGGADPYSSSKACAELVCEAFRRSFFENGPRHVGLATVRAGNVIGGGDWARDRLLPDLARAALTGDTALIRNPGAVRPWQHVLEPLAGYMVLAQRLCEEPQQFSGSWNFGPSPASIQTVEAVVKKVSARWKGKLKWSVDARDHPHEAARLLLDSTKAMYGLDWRTRLEFDAAIEQTADWYEAARSRDADLRQLTEMQIEIYSARESAC
jgi:CDP-glucose 4,6-dehydratase